jgi:hypothetical protein
LIIPCSSAPKLSNNIIQKGLAFRGDWSGTVAHPGRQRCLEILPRWLRADAGLRWCGAMPLNRMEDLNVKVREAIRFIVHCNYRKTLAAIRCRSQE